MNPIELLGKRRTRLLIEGVGGVEAAASLCRVGKTKLSEYQNENLPGVFMPVDVVAALEPLARDRLAEPPVTAWLAMVNGGVFVRLPNDAPGDADALRGFATMAKGYGDASAEFLRAAADGKIEPPEAEIAERKLDDLISYAVHVREIMRAIQRGGQ